MNQTSPPIAHPAPGNYAVDQMVTLTCATPGASIRFTTDGSPPLADGKTFQPYELIHLEAPLQSERGAEVEYTVRAAALKDGMQPSHEVVFHYGMKRRDKDSYVSHEVASGVRMIEDYDSDKMFLVLGSRKALLIDTGMGSGDLRGYVQGLAGDLPLEVVITHGHPDHIARLGQFQPDCPVSMHPADLPLANRFRQQLGVQFELDLLHPLSEGMVFDLGSRQLRVYAVPGHSPGCVALLDEADGSLFAGDALGSNRPHAVDSMWMQMPGMATMDQFLPTLQAFRRQVRGKIKTIYTGHNDLPLYGEAYLDNLEQAVQQVVERGAQVLVPSFRPPGIWQSMVGDRLSDPDWAAINLDRDRLKKP